MNLEGLLTYFGFLAAALAIMGPVQRKALGLFIPKWFMPVSILTALVLLAFRDIPLGRPTIFSWRLDLVTYGLTLGTFLIPVVAALWSWRLWHVAKLTNRSISKLESFLEAALRESEFDEVERVLQKNLKSLTIIPAGAATVLFHPRMVKHLMNSYSVIHIELLASRPVLESLKNRLQAVEVVVREMLSAEASPIQSAVVSRYRGIEHLEFAPTEKRLIASTFQNPDWYYTSNAHYPLIITAVNKIQSGDLDEIYNRPNENYVSNQGVSKRATCPVYLAIKTEVMAIEAAIEVGDERDFYISDLWQIMRAIFERSTFNSASSNLPSGMQSAYTPYSYLINEIAGDLNHLAQKAVELSVRNNSTMPDNSTPTRIGLDLICVWSTCVWLVLSETNRIDTVLRDEMVEMYFRFMFALGWRPSEISFFEYQSISSLNGWRDEMLEQFTEHLVSPRLEELTMLKEVFGKLDLGKPFISDGYDWLQTKLPARFMA